MYDYYTALLVVLTASSSWSSAGWERVDSVTGGSTGIRIVEFTNSSAVSIDCDWTLQSSSLSSDIITASNRRRPFSSSSSGSANNRPIHQQQHHDDGLVADNGDSPSQPTTTTTTTDGIALTWLDANRQPVVSIPGIR